MVWNTMVRPASEVELFDFTNFVIAPLYKDIKKVSRIPPFYSFFSMLLLRA